MTASLKRGTSRSSWIPKARHLLSGAEVDYVDSLQGSGFRLRILRLKRPVGAAVHSAHKHNIRSRAGEALSKKAAPALICLDGVGADDNVRLTKRIEFSASHRYHNPHGIRRAIRGVRRLQPSSGHGHNYLSGSDHQPGRSRRIPAW